MEGYFEIPGNRHRRFAVVVVAVFWSLLAHHGCARAAPGWTRIDERRVSGTLAGEGAVEMPFFDRDGRLQWDASPPAALDTGTCGPDRAVVRRSTWVREPRVDEVLCSGEGSKERLLVGLGAAGGERWRHALYFSSGAHRIEEWVIGADPSALVLSNLAVLSPATGEVLSPAPAHPVSGENRSVPDFDLHHRALFASGDRTFLVFEADVTLLERQGGLYRLDPNTGERELLLPVSTTLLGGYWSVEDMALDGDRKQLYLAQALAIRGPGGVAFAVLDLADRRIVFRDVLAKGRYARAPKLTLGSDGTVGLSYFDEAARKIVLVHYRPAPASNP